MGNPDPVSQSSSGNSDWHIPHHYVHEFAPRKSKYCVLIPVINEGERIRRQLYQMRDIAHDVDIIIVDGGSTDGSMNREALRSLGVRTLLIKNDEGKLGAQLRMGFAYALKEQYQGIITIDGNGKDGVEAIYDFISVLDRGYDFIQGSRFIRGGKALNTPRLRYFAIKFIHAPIVSLLGHFRYTDTTNGFRGHSRRFLLDPRLQPFRRVFQTYELLAYFSVKAPRLGLRVTEIPVTRVYPAQGKIPTKLSYVRGNLLILKILFKLIFGRYEPKM